MWLGENRKECTCLYTKIVADGSLFSDVDRDAGRLGACRWGAGLPQYGRGADHCVRLYQLLDASRLKFDNNVDTSPTLAPNISNPCLSPAAW